MKCVKVYAKRMANSHGHTEEKSARTQNIRFAHVEKHRGTFIIIVKAINETSNEYVMVIFGET